ncbi:hypothetical protein [Solilutibacter silvestris]|uniref:hypothetical protein n=1 Tax=Solilutibacter silvestris TaxID=1645665 RepID=UPI003D32FCC6
MKTISQAVRDIEERTGVPEGFFDNLKSEDDWSFIIKSHALIEASCSQLLTEKFENRELLDVFSRLELGDKQSGKIAFIKSLELLESPERRFISSLSELRNMLVHNVRFTNFDISTYVHGLDKQQKKSFVQNFGYAYLPEKEDEDYESDFQTIIKKPKETIWKGLKLVLAILSLQIESIELKRQMDQHLRGVGRIAKRPVLIATKA